MLLVTIYFGVTTKPEGIPARSIFSMHFGMRDGGYETYVYCYFHLGFIFSRVESDRRQGGGGREKEREETHLFFPSFLWDVLP